MKAETLESSLKIIRVSVILKKPVGLKITRASKKLAKLLGLNQFLAQMKSTDVVLRKGSVH